MQRPVWENMRSRRKFIGAVGVAGFASFAGCSVVEGTFEKSAAPGGVPEATLEATGFEHRETEDIPFRRTVDALGQSRDLQLTNWRVTYGKALEGFGEDAARFRLHSTPSVTVVGNEVNPFAEFGPEQLLGEVSDDEPDEMDEEATRSVRTLGEDVTYTRYEVRQEIGGQPVTASVHVGRFSNEGDLLTAVGTHPEVLDEAENIYELAAAVEHPFES